jgi:ribulose 1,5-bisphosphate carboxylase large subunit-like protein
LTKKRVHHSNRETAEKKKYSIKVAHQETEEMFHRVVFMYVQVEKEMRHCTNADLYLMTRKKHDKFAG